MLFSLSTSRGLKLHTVVNTTSLRNHGWWRNLQRTFLVSVGLWASITSTPPSSPSRNSGGYYSRQFHSRKYHPTSMSAFLFTRFRPSQLALLELLTHHHPTTDLSLAFPSWIPSPFPSTCIVPSFSQTIGAVYGMMKREREM